MHKLARADLLTLEAYAAGREAFRARVLAHKRARRLALGEHLVLLFEDRLTVQHQVQEMLRIERLFEAPDIEQELAAYNPLIPDGGNLKATMLLAYPDPVQRRRELARLEGIEHRLVATVAGQPPVPAIADEDLPRSAAGKTSAVHFLRFEFPPAAVQALRAGAALGFAVQDPRLPCAATCAEPTRLALLADFD